MEVWLLLIMGAVNIACFLIGAKVGQTVSKDQPIQLPNLAKAVQDHEEKKQAQIKHTKMETILRNLERYDGTSYGQEEV